MIACQERSPRIKWSKGIVLLKFATSITCKTTCYENICCSIADFILSHLIQTPMIDDKIDSRSLDISHGLGGESFVASSQTSFFVNGLQTMKGPTVFPLLRLESNLDEIYRNSQWELSSSCYTTSKKHRTVICLWGWGTFSTYVKDSVFEMDPY